MSYIVTDFDPIPTFYNKIFYFGRLFVKQEEIVPDLEIIVNEQTESYTYMGR